MLVVGFRVLRDFHAAYLADNVSRAGVPARAIVLDRRVDGRPEANSLGLGRAFDDPGTRAEIAADVGRRARRHGARRLPGRPGDRGPPRRVERPPGAARAPRVRDPDAAAVGAGHARLPHAARPPARARRAGDPQLGGDRAAPGGRVERLRASAAGRDGRVPRRLGRARHRRRRDRRDRARLALAAREKVLGLPLAGALEPGAQRFRRATSTTTRSTRSASRSTTACAPSSPPPAARLYENVLVAGATLAERAAVEGEVGRRDQPGHRPPRRGDHPGGGARNDRRALRRHARLARPLRQVHDLRDRVPVLQRHAAVPRAEVRRPAGRALPHRRAGRPTRRSTTARAAASARRSARRACTSPRSTRARRRAARARRHAAARPADRPPDARRAARHARRADRQLDAAQPRLPAAPREDRRHPPRRGDADVRRAHVPGLGAPPPRARGEAARRVLPRLRRELLRAAARRDDGRGARPQRARGRRAQAGLLRPAAAVQRDVRRRAAVRAPPRRPAGAGGGRRRRRDRRDVHELHADAQARGEGHPRHGGRPAARARRLAARTTSSSSSSSCTSAASCAPTSSRST